MLHKKLKTLVNSIVLTKEKYGDNCSAESVPYMQPPSMRYSTANVFCYTECHWHIKTDLVKIARGIHIDKGTDVSTETVRYVTRMTGVFFVNKGGGGQQSVRVGKLLLLTY